LFGHRILPKDEKKSFKLLPESDILSVNLGSVPCNPSEEGREQSSSTGWSDVGSFLSNDLRFRILRLSRLSSFSPTLAENDDSRSGAQMEENEESAAPSTFG